MTENLVDGNLKERSTPFWSSLYPWSLLIIYCSLFFVLSGIDDVSTLSSLFNGV